MMKAKKVLKTTLAAFMAATAITAVAIPASADCTGWMTDYEVSRYCDYNSGWCYWNNWNHSYFVKYRYHKICDVNNKAVTKYKYESVKTGCCS